MMTSPVNACRISASSFSSSVWRTMPDSIGDAHKLSKLRPRPIQHARERDGFANVLQPAHPRDEALDAHAESGVRNGAVLAQVEVPVERFARQIVFVQALQQQIQIVNALPAADDFAVAFGRDEIDAQRELPGAPARAGNRTP